MPRHTRHPAEQVAPGRLSVSVAHYLAVYLRLWDSLGCRIHRRRGHLQAVSLCNDTTGTHPPGDPACERLSLYFPAHKFISWKTSGQLAWGPRQDGGHRILWPKRTTSGNHQPSPRHSTDSRQDILNVDFTDFHGDYGDLARYASNCCMWIKCIEWYCDN